jgi:type IV secretory pathway ATPase VirB11/archaellum biosynthesis ATPase
MGELRGGETFDFINLALSGLNGSITTLHAGSVDSCLVRLRDMAIMSEEGRSLPYEVLKSDLFQAVDVIVNLVWNESLEGLDKRCVQSIWYDPSKKEKLV